MTFANTRTRAASLLPKWLAEAKRRDTGRGLGCTDLEIARRIDAEKLAA